MVAVSTSILDHIVHITPPGTLPASIDAFHKLGFTVSLGGTHADGLTANALVVLPDGTYLELLHFTAPPPPDSTHPWAKKQPGWADFAFLGNAGAPSVAATINARAEQERSGARYAAEVRGGREREDGRVLEWLISAPERGGEGESVRGRLPFFCGDLTPRDWRVPLEPRENTQHENGAVGTAYVRLLVAPEELETAAKQMTSVVGVAPSSSAAGQVIWELAGQPSHHGNPELVVGAVRDDEERRYVQEHGPGIYEIGFHVAKGGTREGIAKTPYGRVVWRIA